MAYVPFVSITGLPTLITAPGQYITRCGEIVAVERITPRHDFGCDGSYPDGTLESWHRTGRLYYGCESRNDIVGAAPAPTTQPTLENA